MRLLCLLEERDETEVQLVELPVSWNDALAGPGKVRKDGTKGEYIYLLAWSTGISFQEQGISTDCMHNS